ncbi:9683_t:CDS:1, partial [Dentiscutata heterogama]
DTASKRIYEKTERSGMVIDFKNLCEADNKWNKKMDKFKAWINEKAKHSKTHLKS